MAEIGCIVGIIVGAMSEFLQDKRNKIVEESFTISDKMSHKRMHAIDSHVYNLMHILIFILILFIQILS